MNILHIAFIVNNKANGVSIVVPKYVEEQSKYENVGLLNLSSYVITEKIGNAKIFDCTNISINQLEEPFNKPDLVIFHEVYRYPFIKIYKELLNKKIPYIIIPHGSLNKKAQRKNKLKKIIGNMVFFKRFIKNATKVQFLTNKEKDTSLKFNKESYVLGNGMYIDKSIKTKSNKYKTFKYIYIGRFDIKIKGIDMLLKACKYNKKFMRENNIKLEIYGKNAGKIKGREYIENYIKNNKIDDIIILNSEVYDKEKVEKLLDADIFIQTSRNEGQPLSVLEALGYGKPVIVTPGTNFSEIVEKENMGWATKLKPKDIAIKMREVYKFSKEKGLNTYSNNAKKYIKENFMWEKITKETLEIYKKIIEDERNRKIEKN